MMKRLYWLTFALVMLSMGSGCSQNPATPEEAYRDFWKKTDAEFADPEKSPLSAAEIADFDSVPRYAYNEAYRATARWEPLTGQKPMTFETTGPRKQRYQKAGILHFSIDSVELQVSAYRNLDLMRDPVYRDRLFIPYTDETSGFDTYGGGRYVEIETPGGAEAILDFNVAYNPYCVYNDGYSCPIPPRENHLEVEILAGARVE